jgi:hypothetical protein
MGCYLCYSGFFFLNIKSLLRGTIRYKKYPKANNEQLQQYRQTRQFNNYKAPTRAYNKHYQKQIKVAATTQKAKKKTAAATNTKEPDRHAAAGQEQAPEAAKNQPLTVTYSRQGPTPIHRAKMELSPFY